MPVLRFYTLVVIWLCAVSVAFAQRDRITASVDESRLITLRGNVHPKARPEADQGLADPSVELTYITMSLKTSATQQPALEQLLENQQNPSSPDYHSWVTPEQFGDRFGATPSDIAKLTAWLKSRGFTIDETARGRNWVAFSGSVRALQSALPYEIHRYIADGEIHLANSKDPSIPEAFQSVVAGFSGLTDFPCHAQ